MGKSFVLVGMIPDKFDQTNDHIAVSLGVIKIDHKYHNERMKLM